MISDLTLTSGLVVRVTTPDAGGPHPVVVFSPHSGGQKEHYGPLMAHWASNGYVCVQPDHSDAGRTGRDILDFSNRWQRVADVSAAIDALGHISEQAGVAVDEARVGAAGNLYGGDTVELACGMRAIGPDGPTGPSTRDERIGAVIVMSGQGRGQGLTEASWAALELPMLVLAGTAAPSRRTGNDPMWRTEPFRFSPPGDKYLVYVDGLSPELAGLGIPPRGQDERLAQIVLESTTLFLDAYLKQDAAAATALRDGSLRGEGVTFETR